MTNSKELIELVDSLEQRLLELSSTQAFRYRAKASAKKNLYSIINIGIEIKHALVMGGEPNSKAVIDALNFMNKKYTKLFDSRNRTRTNIYEAEKPY